MAALASASGIWSQKSLLYICIGKQYLEKRGSPLFHCFSSPFALFWTFRSATYRFPAWTHWMKRANYPRVSGLGDDGGWVEGAGFWCRAWWGWSPGWLGVEWGPGGEWWGTVTGWVATENRTMLGATAAHWRSLGKLWLGAGWFLYLGLRMTLRWRNLEKKRGPVWTKEL